MPGGRFAGMLDKDVNALNEVISSYFDAIAGVLGLAFLLPCLYILNPVLFLIVVACIPIFIGNQLRVAGFITREAERLKNQSKKRGHVAGSNGDDGPMTPEPAGKKKSKVATCVSSGRFSNCAPQENVAHEPIDLAGDASDGHRTSDDEDEYEKFATWVGTASQCF